MSVKISRDNVPLIPSLNRDSRSEIEGNACCQRTMHCFKKVAQNLVPFSGGTFDTQNFIRDGRVVVRRYTFLYFITTVALFALWTRYRWSDGRFVKVLGGTLAGFFLITIADLGWSRWRWNKAVLKECLQSPHPKYGAMSCAVNELSKSLLKAIPQDQRRYVLGKTTVSGDSFLGVCWDNSKREKLMEAGADPTFIPSGGTSALARAIGCGSDSAIQCYTKNREISEEDQVGYFAAVRKVDTLKFLVETVGFNPNAKKDGKPVILHLIHENEFPEKGIGELIRLGADRAPLDAYLESAEGLTIFGLDSEE